MGTTRGAPSPDNREDLPECPVCEYVETRLLYRLNDRLLPSSAETFPLYRCPSCGSLLQDVRRIEGRLDEFYPDSYWWKEDGMLSSMERSYREWVVRHDHLSFVKSVFPESRNLRLLDIGCGSGVFLKLAHEAGFDAYGLDRSTAAVQAAGKEVPNRVFLGSEEDLIADDESFDILAMFHTLEHLTDPFRYLKSIRRLLRRPGNLVVQVPNGQSWQARLLGPRWYGFDCPRHICNFTLYSLLYLLGRAGFRIERVRHFSLRDNAPAIVSSLFPGLDPIGRRIRDSIEKRQTGQMGRGVAELVYFALVMSAQPLAWIESKMGRGGTVTVHATLNQ